MEISIVIPVYNKAEYIGGCLDCLLQQDFDNFEVICVCDGSTDNSGEICDQWAAKDQHIRVIHKDNGGVTAARRRGVEEAQGKYVMFVDADDKLLPGALRSLYDTIEQTQADEVVARFQSQDGVVSPVVYQGFTPVEPLIRAIITGKNRFPVLWGIIFNRKLLEGTLDTPREIIEGEDKMMQVKILAKNPVIYFTETCVYEYQVGLPNNRRHQLEREQLYDQILHEVLQAHFNDYKLDFTLHQLKEYEKFVYEGQYEVRRLYYGQTLRHLPAGLPLYDRLVWMLPPRVSRQLIKLYRAIIKMKQKGL